MRASPTTFSVKSLKTPSVSRANVTHFSTIELGALLRLSELVCHKEWHSRRKLFSLANIRGFPEGQHRQALRPASAADAGTRLQLVEALSCTSAGSGEDRRRRR